MTNDDLIDRHRLQLFERAEQVGVSRACRELGFHRSTYYHWKPLVLRHGLVILRPRERRPPRMPNQIPPWLEQKIIAAALGEPGRGPRRLAADIPQSLGEAVRPGGVFNLLRRSGLQRAHALGSCLWCAKDAPMRNRMCRQISWAVQASGSSPTETGAPRP